MLARWIVFGYIAFIVAPIAMLVIGAFGQLWVATVLPEGATLRWVGMLMNDPLAWRGLGTSVVVATGALALNLVVVPALAGALTLRPGRAMAALGIAMRIAPVAVPTGVFGFALATALASRPSFLQGSVTVLILAHTVLTLPYMLTPLLADLRERDAAGLLRMAASLGAGPVRGFATIVLPAARTGLIAGAAAVVAVSLGEFQLTNLVAGFLDRTYPLVVADGFQRATGFACAATLPLVLLAFANAFINRLVGQSKGRQA